MLAHVRDFCVEHQVTHVFLLGDVFHSRTKIDIDVFSATWEAFRRIAEVVNHLVILRGNHDTYDKEGDKHSLSSFSEFAHVVDKPVVWDLGGVKIAAHPFTTDMDQWKTFAKAVQQGLDFFLFHQGVTDGLVGAFNIALKAEVDVNDIPLTKAAYCLAGHYHKYQWMRPNLAFAGSPLQHSFNERTEEKGFLFFERDGKWEHKFIQTNAPTFKLFSQEELDEAVETGLDLTKHYVRVQVPSSLVSEYAERYPNIQIEPIVQEVEKQQTVDESVVSDDRKLLELYLSNTNLQGLDKDELLQIGLSLLSSSE